MNIYYVSANSVFYPFQTPQPAEKTLLLTAGLILISCCLMHAMGTFTYGAAMRHRTKLFPLEIILVYPCYEIMKERLKGLSGIL